ncbi:MAG: hypothetical protein FJW39_09035 [Acidobacteria bacterium]|nr:hypothetical protein [Acidobacteriota bacterium]
MLVAAGTAPAQTKPFSHQFHLKMGLQCGGCHPSAAASSKAADNNLPAQEACRTCHKQDMPVKQPAKLTVSRFSHEFHLKFGDVSPLIAAAVRAKTYLGPVAGEGPVAAANACLGCHRGIATSDQVGPEVFPHMADCLVCHNKIDNPFSCELCHEPGKHLKPADHTRTYVDTHSTGKMKLDKASCVICHGKKFTCLGCH